MALIYVQLNIGSKGLLYNKTLRTIEPFIVLVPVGIKARIAELDNIQVIIGQNQQEYDNTVIIPIGTKFRMNSKTLYFKTPTPLLLTSATLSLCPNIPLYCDSEYICFQHSLTVLV